MYCKEITYTDFEGNKRTEKFYFNLTEAELVEWMSTNSDYTYDRVIEEMTTKMDSKGLIESIRELIYRSYGEKSLDGRRFIKTEEVKSNFMDTNAYSVLFMEMMQGGEAAAEFFNNIIPKDLANTVNKLMSEHPNATPDELRTMAATGEIKITN